ncbi:unnamed protein product [Parnassius apollo]|uniref:(apollo) hypothetical protein n=1 Tax=Parnassius apollo TaxID=110799 RepID=A0A8S3YA25_PARAO|nr:unnamed protein product [Parnassius apollo]
MDEQQQRLILSWLEEDANDTLGGDDEENETGMFPDQVGEHDTDSEQECDDDLYQIFSNYDISLEMPNEEHLGFVLVNESTEVLKSAFSDGDGEPLIKISTSNFYIVKKGEKLHSKATIRNLPRELRHTVEEDLYHHFRMFKMK